METKKSKLFEVNIISPKSIGNIERPETFYDWSIKTELSNWSTKEPINNLSDIKNVMIISEYMDDKNEIIEDFSKSNNSGKIIDFLSVNSEMSDEEKANKIYDFTRDVDITFKFVHKEKKYIDIRLRYDDDNRICHRVAFINEILGKEKNEKYGRDEGIRISVDGINYYVGGIRIADNTAYETTDFRPTEPEDIKYWKNKSKAIKKRMNHKVIYEDEWFKKRPEMEKFRNRE